MELEQLAKAITHLMIDIIIGFLKAEPLEKVEIILSVIALVLVSYLVWMLFSFVVTVFYVALT